MAKRNPQYDWLDAPLKNTWELENTAKKKLYDANIFQQRKRSCKSCGTYHRAAVSTATHNASSITNSPCGFEQNDRG